jgi:hypothetical protein
MKTQVIVAKATFHLWRKQRFMTTDNKLCINNVKNIRHYRINKNEFSYYK